MDVRFPAELAECDQWIAWRYETRGGKQTKVPYSPHLGKHASTTDSRTWASLDVAVRYVEASGMDGLGFVFSSSDPFVGIDLDHCYNPGEKIMELWAEVIIATLDSYTELSPSGTGVHIIVQGMLPPGQRRKDQIEMYDSGRFFCMTGQLWGRDWPKGTVEVRTRELAVWHAELFGRNNGHRAEHVPPAHVEPIELPIDKLGALLLNDDEFAGVWNRTMKTRGDQSASGLDFLLTRKALEAGFSDSEIAALLLAYRKKWKESTKRPDYYERTIDNAKNPLDAIEAGDKAGILGGLSQLWGITISRIVRYVSMDEEGREDGEPSYRLETECGIIDIGHIEAIDNPHTFRRRLAALTGRVIPIYYTQKTWLPYAQRLLDLAETESTGTAGTLKGEVYEWIDEYLSHGPARPSHDPTKSILARTPFWTTGRLHIFGEPLRHWLITVLHERLDKRDMGAKLRAVGCSAEIVSYITTEGKQTSTYCWRLPDELAAKYGGEVMPNV